MMGMSDCGWLASCRTSNVFRRWPGPPHRGTKGDAFPHARARRAVPRALSKFLPGDVVVLVGRQVARAFGVRDKGVFRWFVLWRWDEELMEPHAHFAVVVPHPSGANHWWNRQANRDRAAFFFAALAEWDRHRRERFLIEGSG